MIVMRIINDQLVFDTPKFEILDNSFNQLFRVKVTLSAIDTVKLLPTNKQHFLDRSPWCLDMCLQIC